MSYSDESPGAELVQSNRGLNSPPDLWHTLSRRVPRYRSSDPAHLSSTRTHNHMIEGFPPPQGRLKGAGMARSLQVTLRGPGKALSAQALAPSQIQENGMK